MCQWETATHLIVRDGESGAGPVPHGTMAVGAGASKGPRVVAHGEGIKLKADYSVFEDRTGITWRDHAAARVSTEHPLHRTSTTDTRQSPRPHQDFIRFFKKETQGALHSHFHFRVLCARSVQPYAAQLRRPSLVPRGRPPARGAEVHTRSPDKAEALAPLLPSEEARLLRRLPGVRLLPRPAALLPCDGWRSSALFAASEGRGARAALPPVRALTIERTRLPPAALIVTERVRREGSGVAKGGADAAARAAWAAASAARACPS